MSRTLYRRERVLARKIRRIGGEDREAYKARVRRLKEHFEAFNTNMSEICQWLMGFRPNGKRGDESTKIFWDFFLQPENCIQEQKEVDLDRNRRRLFDFIASFEEEHELEKFNYEPSLINSAKTVKNLPKTPTAQKLFERMASMDKPHRQILLKAAADWVYARYERGMENFENSRKLWENEKNEWEKTNPTLTPETRDEFTQIFREMEIRKKNPRICGWDRFKGQKDNCEYAGERIGGINHGPLCKKYKIFYDRKNRGHGSKAFSSHFIENAKSYLEARKKQPHITRDGAMKQIFSTKKAALQWFPQAWKEYLRELEIATEDKALTHCTNFGNENECEYNPHTDDCKSYKSHLAEKKHLWEFEGLYREWRKDFLAGPRKPSFKYPSSRLLPTPKIFGKGYFKIDFDKSEVHLRLDDMAEGEFEKFGFEPWPGDYSPQPDEAEITSVHVNFIGTRARVAFRFAVEHKDSHFKVSQDEIDELRRKKYPRKSQDAEFLEEARKMLLQSFVANPGRNLKILAVDLGSSNAYAAFFKGKKSYKTRSLKILKIDRLYSKPPKKGVMDGGKNDKTAEKGKKGKQKIELKFPKETGLTREHVGVHLEKWSEEAGKIAKKRGNKNAVLGEHDLRGLTIHTKRMIRDWARLNASQIIKAAEEHGADLIVFESMRGFRAKGYDVNDPEQKKRLAFFAYGRIRQKAAEKAVERGMRVVTVPYKYSSQICSKCGKLQEKAKDKKRSQRFECEDKKNCGYKANSDENAAIVLGKVFWGDIKLPEKPPEHT